MGRMRWTHAICVCTPLVLAVPSSPSGASGAPAASDPELARLDETLPGDLINDPRILVELSQNLGGAETEVIKSDTIPGGGAARGVRVRQVPAQGWQISASVGLTRPVARGDVVTVGFYARALPMDAAPAQGRIGLRIQQNVSPWAGFLDKSFDIGPQWQWYETAGVSNVALAGGQSAVSFVLGERAQNVQIGQVIVVKGANAIAAALPEPPVPLPPQIVKVDGALFNRPQDGPWNFHGTGGEQQRFADQGIFLGKASRVTVHASQGRPWDLEMAIPLSGPVVAGDRFLVAIAARTVSSEAEDGKATINVRFQSTQPPYNGFADNALRPGVNWQLLQLRTTAVVDIPPGEAVFKLMFAGQKQVVDIGPVYILKLK